MEFENLECAPYSSTDPVSLGLKKSRDEDGGVVREPTKIVHGILFRFSWGLNACDGKQRSREKKRQISTGPLRFKGRRKLEGNGYCS
jgi:hypothetical protein